MKTLAAPYLIAGGLIAAALVYISMQGGKKVGQQVGATAVDLADGVVGGVVVASGQLVGIPATDSDMAIKLMNEFPYLPWYEQATASFKIAAYASATDYLHWVADHSYRPKAGSY